ncbi:hypothetical protein SAKG18_20680 [Staphylococcus aureus]|nr:hypothetical protein SAKG18_20680 [Staphylococcus aureus]
MFLSLKTLYRKRTVIWPFYFYTIIRTLSEGGLGLFLIESLMDEVTVYKESGVTISMTKYIKKEQVRNNGERVEIS